MKNKLDLPIIWNYGEYSSDNYGRHTLAMRYTTKKGKIDLYYSYDTIVAFVLNGQLVISRNEWGTTTGKHLNFIDSDHKKRIKYAEFQKQLEKALNTL